MLNNDGYKGKEFYIDFHSSRIPYPLLPYIEIYPRFLKIE